MDKPQPEDLVFYSYQKIQDYLEVKHDVSLSDFARSRRHFGDWCDRKRYGDQDPEGKQRSHSQVWWAEYKQDPDGEAQRPPYQNFWHWMVEHNEPKRGALWRWYAAEDLEIYADLPDFVRTILGWIVEEFGEDFYVWTDW